MNIKTAKKLLSGIRYSQGRNKISNRPVKDIEITVYDLIDMYNRQHGNCYWSGLPLDARYNEIKHHPFAISPDRLDNSLAYTVTNVVLTRRMFNLGRMSYPNEEFKIVMEILKHELMVEACSSVG